MRSDHFRPSASDAEQLAYAARVADFAGRFPGQYTFFGDFAGNRVELDLERLAGEIREPCSPQHKAAAIRRFKKAISDLSHVLAPKYRRGVTDRLDTTLKGLKTKEDA